MGWVLELTGVEGKTDVLCTDACAGRKNRREARIKAIDHLMCAGAVM